MSIRAERDGSVAIISIDRPDVRNAVNPATAEALFHAFVAFDDDDSADVAILTGTGGAFCGGFDLAHAANGVDEDWFAAHAIEGPEDFVGRRPGPMGPTRLQLSKPVIAAVEGAAVAGGMELALWCDLRVMATDSFMGVYCRRWGVPLIDGGAIRLPRLVGQGRALELILTGRKVGADEAKAIGLADRLAPPGMALEAAVALAQDVVRFPQACMRADRSVVLDQWSLAAAPAFAREWRSAATIRTEGAKGAARFRDGKGRSGAFDDI